MYLSLSDFLPGLLSTLVLSSCPLIAAEFEAPHVAVTCENITAGQAHSIAETVSAARRVYVEDFGFDMPEKIRVSVNVNAQGRTSLYTDGDERVYLELTSADELGRPERTGVFNLYGLCHELGHMAMYRLLNNRLWLTAAGAEGWAHYAGSVVVDRVYEQRGGTLWFDPYDYRLDGTARLAKELASPEPSETAMAAGAWRDLAGLIRRRGFAKLFRAWQAADISALRPEAGIDRVFSKEFQGGVKALSEWWTNSKPLLARRLELSPFPVRHAPASELSGRSVRLAKDDGTAEDKMSIGGGGPARLFQAPTRESDWWLSEVEILGERYGAEEPPAELFDIVLCDAEMRPIAIWRQPYSLFPRGELQLVRFDVSPVLVPDEFYLFVDFHATGGKGVSVGIDESTAGNSHRSGLGRLGSALDNGDWIIRATLRQRNGKRD